MALSATSSPGGTCRKRITGEGGIRSQWLATRVSGIFTRSAARNRISLITPGQASASTQMRPLAELESGIWLILR
ncbi:hypothetical protein D3C71_1790980 [compost metagenome]